MAAPHRRLVMWMSTPMGVRPSRLYGLGLSAALACAYGAGCESERRQAATAELARREVESSVAKVNHLHRPVRLLRSPRPRDGLAPEQRRCFAIRNACRQNPHRPGQPAGSSAHPAAPICGLLPESVGRIDQRARGLMARVRCECTGTSSVSLFAASRTRFPTNGESIQKASRLSPILLFQRMGGYSPGAKLPLGFAYAQQQIGS